MNSGSTDVDVLVKTAETSYIQLLHKTSLETEKLKLIVYALMYKMNQNHKFPPDIKQQIQDLELKLIDINNNNHSASISAIVRFPYDAEEKCDGLKKLATLTRAKLSLIESSSFEIDRLRTTIKCLTDTNEEKIAINNNNWSRRLTDSVGIRKRRLTDSVNIRKIYDWDEICKHCDEEDLWLVHEGKVYNATTLLKHHPGGSDRIIKFTSRNQDITAAVTQLNHPPIYYSVLNQYCIGTVSNKQKDRSLPNSSFDDIKPMWDSHLTNTSYHYDELIQWRGPDREPIIKWDDYFSVNINILDKQQQHLIELINNLYFNYELHDINELLYRWDVHCKTEETLFFYYDFQTDLQEKHNVDSKKIYHQIKDEITALRIKYDNSKPKCEELKSFAQSAAQRLKQHHAQYDTQYRDELHQAMDDDDGGYGWINHWELKSIILSNNLSNYLVVDVRDRKMDYTGGSIINSINISDKVFCDQLPSFIAQYHNKPYIIIYCMYGAHRSKKCIRFYSKMAHQIINNYSKQNQSSFYNKLGHGMDKISKIEIKCNDELISNLQKQKIFVLKNGFFEFVNALLENDSKQILNILQDFNPLQFKLISVDDKTIWRHKNEYFAKTNEHH